jgi:adenosylhomocysteinase
MARQQSLGFPVIAARQATTTHLVDSRYGSGQSTFDALLQASGVLLAGLTVVVAGFGWTGKGLAARARGLGANVVVTEVHPLRAIEAVMEGHRVLSMNEAAAIGDVFITGTGTRTVLAREHFDRLKDGAMLANAGDCRAEIDLEMLGRMSNSRKELREYVEEYRLRDGRRVWVLADGRPLNVAVRGGQPPSVRDVTLANHALSAEYLVRQSALLEKKVHPVPETIDRQVARMKLSAMRIAIDKLTIEQEEYLAGWSEGT